MVFRSFEYCSLHYLNQWIIYDSQYCKAFKSGRIAEKPVALTKFKNFIEYLGIFHEAGTKENGYQDSNRCRI